MDRILTLSSRKINFEMPQALGLGTSVKTKRDKKHVNHNLPLSQPKRWLFDSQNLPSFAWDHPTGPGAGLLNPGINICFMNAILQALTYAPGLGNDLISRNHSRNCPHYPRKTFCATCRLEDQVNLIYSQPKGCVSNRIYLSVKRLIWKRYRIGQQEDAHEFLRYFMEALIQGCLPPDIHVNPHGRPSCSDEDWMTTYICQLFGSWLKSSINCEACGFLSNKYDPCLDFSIEISASSSVEKALSEFIKPEKLTGSNRYMCPACCKRQDATKRLHIHQPPKLLTLPLKRFGCNMAYVPIKNVKPVDYPSRLDLTPFLSSEFSASNSDTYQYELWAIVCHLGHSLGSGHYLTYARVPNGKWYCFDDERVSQVSESRVLSQKRDAYILFYAQCNPVSSGSTSSIATNSSPKSVEGPQSLKLKKSASSDVINSVHGQGLTISPNNQIKKSPTCVPNSIKSVQPSQQLKETDPSLSPISKSCKSQSPRTDRSLSLNEMPGALLSLLNKSGHTHSTISTKRASFMLRKPLLRIKLMSAFQRLVYKWLECGRMEQQGKSILTACDSKTKSKKNDAPKKEKPIQSKAKQQTVKLAITDCPASSPVLDHSKISKKELTPIEPVSMISTVSTKPNIFRRIQDSRAVEKQFGHVKVLDWEGETSVMKGSALEHQVQQQPPIAKRDLHDRLYDRGRKKKVRKSNHPLPMHTPRGRMNTRGRRGMRSPLRTEKSAFDQVEARKRKGLRLGYRRSYSHRGRGAGRGNRGQNRYRGFKK